MNYKFPYISDISDVLPAIESRDEFVVGERDQFTVINYVVSKEDTFDILDESDKYGIIRRECRGLIFDKNGKLISRPFHKFFNIGERQETLPDKVDFTFAHRILDKVDGSMVRPLLLDDHIRWATKMGISDVAMKAEVFVAKNIKYKIFAEFCIQSNLTPLFEYVGPNNKIVLHYDNEDMILLAVRNNYTGEYRDIHNDPKLSAKTNELDIPVVGYIDNFNSVSELIDYVRPLEDVEGFVIAFDDGHRFKIKADQYVRIHKAIDRIRHDRHIVDIILNQEMDDLIPMLPESQSRYVKNFERKFWDAYNRTSDRLNDLYQVSQSQYDSDRKRVALELVPTLKHKEDSAILFGLLSGKNLQDQMINTITRGINNTVKYQRLTEWMEFDEQK